MSAFDLRLHWLTEQVAESMIIELEWKMISIGQRQRFSMHGDSSRVWRSVRTVGSYGGFTVRHNNLRVCLFRWFKKSIFLTEKKKIGLLSAGKKPADICVKSPKD